MNVSFSFPSFLLPAVILVIAVCYYIIIKTQTVPILKVSRLLVVTGVLILLLSPSVITYKREQKNTLAVMVDSSDSMFLTKRIDDVKRHLKINHKTISDRFNLLFFEFSENFRELDLQKLSSLKPQGMTDILNSIRNLNNAYADKIDGILLFSDGQDTVNEPDEFDEFESLTPIFPWNIFKDQKIKDLSIVEVKRPNFAFKGSEVSVVAKIQHSGIRATQVVSKLLSEDNELLDTKNNFVASDGETEVRFSIKPKRVGRNNFTLRISTFAGELTFTNNKQNFSIDVMRDKLRILYLCGQPSYEYSFLREFIKNNPANELVTFVILRNPEDIALVPDEELSLIPFPGADILIKELPEFDIVIFENFTYQRFGIYAPHFELLKKWIENGGGFLMLAGENSFGKGGYQHTAIKDVLPVVMDRPGEPFEEGLFKPQILNYDNPIFQTTEGKEFWKGFSELDSAQPLRPHPQGTVLMRHPWAKTESGNFVVLAIRQYGKGKTAAVGSNSTWRWKMHSENPSVYDTFWKNMFDYLSGTSDYTKTTIFGLKETVTVGERYEFAVKIQDPQASIRIEVISPDGTKIAPEISKSGQFMKAAFRVASPGKYVVEFLIYKNRRLVSKERYTVISAKSSAEELRRLDINRKCLLELAQKTDGLYLEGGISEIEKLSRKLGRAKAKEVKSEIRINTTAAAFFVFFVLFVSELVLRRRRYGLW